MLTGLLISGVCEADCVRHSGVLSDHPDWRLCQSCYCTFLELLLVLGPGGWICKSGWFQINQMFNIQATELKSILIVHNISDIIHAT